MEYNTIIVIYNNISNSKQFVNKHLIKQLKVSRTIMCLPVWRDRVRRLTTDPVVMRSSPATGHIRCALLANHPK